LSIGLQPVNRSGPYYRLRVVGTKSWVREVAPNQGTFSGLLNPLIYSVKIIICLTILIKLFLNCKLN
jgi:hypothetical protein